LGVERFESEDFNEDCDEIGDEERVIEVTVDALETIVTASSLVSDSFSPLKATASSCGASFAFWLRRVLGGRPKRFTGFFLLEMTMFFLPRLYLCPFWNGIS
jgi:hypothetical protein